MQVKISKEYKPKERFTWGPSIAGDIVYLGRAEAVDRRRDSAGNHHPVPRDATARWGVSPHGQGSLLSPGPGGDLVDVDLLDADDGGNLVDAANGHKGVVVKKNLARIIVFWAFSK